MKNSFLSVISYLGSLVTKIMGSRRCLLVGSVLASSIRSDIKIKYKKVYLQRIPFSRFLAKILRVNTIAMIKYLKNLSFSRSRHSCLNLTHTGLVRITTWLFTPLMLCVLILNMSGEDLYFLFDFELQTFGNLFIAVLEEMAEKILFCLVLPEISDYGFVVSHPIS